MAYLPASQFRAQLVMTDFPGTMAPFTRTVTFTQADLAHALFTTGRAPGDRAMYGAASFWELLHRTSLIPAYVRIAGDSRLVRSRLAMDLDRSEKVSLSYALGQAMTAIVCRQVAGAKWLMHIERYANRFGINFGSARTRPDLFGWRPAGWIVAEAKGRSGGIERGLRTKLVTQKRSVASISGIAPSLALGCVASFPPQWGVLRLDAFDPTDIAAEPIDLDEIDLDRMVQAYYEPFLTALQLGESQQVDDGTITARFDNFRVRIGLTNVIYERLLSGSGSTESSLASDVLQLPAHRPKQRETLETAQS